MTLHSHSDHPTRGCIPRPSFGGQTSAGPSARSIDWDALPPVVRHTSPCPAHQLSTAVLRVVKQRRPRSPWGNSWGGGRDQGWGISWGAISFISQILSFRPRTDKPTLAGIGNRKRGGRASPCLDPQCSAGVLPVVKQRRLAFWGRLWDGVRE